MNDTRQNKIDSILFKVEACYPGEFNAGSIDVWHDALAEYSVDDISAAFTKYVKQNKKPYLPVIGQIVAIIEQQRNPAAKIQVRSLQEWRKVVHAVRQRGEAKGPPQFEDHVTKYLIQTQFSWHRLCNMEVDKEHWEQRRWCEAFELVDEATINLILIEESKRIKKLAAKIGNIEDSNDESG